MEQNPYQSPTPSPGQPIGPGRPPIEFLVGHVPIIAILMLIQGGLECLMGAFLRHDGAFHVHDDVATCPRIRLEPRRRRSR